MLTKEKIAIQELLASDGWRLFRELIYTDSYNSHNKLERRSLRGKLQADLLVAGRDGDGLKAAKATAGLDLLDVILDVPVKYLKGGSYD